MRVEVAALMRVLVLIQMHVRAVIPANGRLILRTASILAARRAWAAAVSSLTRGWIHSPGLGIGECDARSRTE
jgi:hypothetical protein